MFEVVSSLGAGEDGVRCWLMTGSMCRSARRILRFLIEINILMINNKRKLKTNGCFNLLKIQIFIGILIKQ